MLANKRAAIEDTIFFCCDIQTSVEYTVINYPTLCKNAMRLAQLAKLLQIPVIVTTHETYGPVPEIISSQFYEGVKLYEDKHTMSMLGHELVKAHLDSMPERKTVVLYGCDTHVCIKQTAFDLMELGYTVHICVNAVTNKHAHDRNVGI